MPNSYVRHVWRKIKRAVLGESLPPASAYKWFVSYWDVNAWRNVTHTFTSRKAAQAFQARLLRDRNHPVHAQGANMRMYQKKDLRQ